MSQDHSDRFFESDSFFLKVGQRPVTRAAEEKRFPRAQPCTCTSTLHSYIYIYIYIYLYGTPPPPMYPRLSSQSRLWEAMGSWDALVPMPFSKISAAERRGLMGSGECL